MLQVVSLTPTSNVKVVAELKAPLTETQFNAVLALNNGRQASINYDLYKSANESFMFGMNMDCGYPILSYDDYVDYWSDYYQPLTEAQFNGLEGHYTEEGYIPDWLHNQIMDCNSPNSVYRSDYDGELYFGSYMIGGYYSYLKQCESKMSEYKKQFRG